MRAPPRFERPIAEVRAAFPERGLSPGRRLCRAADRPPEGLCAAADRRPFPLSARASNSFPRDHFPWLAALEAKTAEIRRELLSLLDEGDRGFRPYIAFDATQPVNQWAELNHSPRWSAWFFWEDGVRQDENCARCPATAAALEALPMLDLPGKGPTALFSILEPRTRIPPHTGSSNVRTTVHLPLVVPRGLRIPGRVGDSDLRGRQGLGVRRHDRARGLERQRRTAGDPHLRHLESAAQRSGAGGGEGGGMMKLVTLAASLLLLGAAAQDARPPFS